jgi:DNA polymerase III alpha subunit
MWSPAVHLLVHSEYSLLDGACRGVYLFLERPVGAQLKTAS